MTILATAYCACTLCTGPTAPRLTASGVWPVPGITIAAPRNVPFGTVVRLNGHRYVVQDRTRTGRGWDIYMPTHHHAIRHGRRRYHLTIP